MRPLRDVFRAASGIACLVAAHAPRVASADDTAQGSTRETEWGFVPLAGGSSDVGIGFGQLSSITRFEPGWRPYRWHLETGAFISFMSDRIPFQDYYATLTLPDLIRDVLRLELRPSYTRESTIRYYGLGNASPPATDVRELEYTRTHPTMWARVYLSLHRSVLYAKLGASFTYDELTIPPGTRLARDMASTDPRTLHLLGDARAHSVWLFEDALVYDTRDDETNPKRGTWDAFTVRTSPGGTAAFPYRYAVLTWNVRGYVTPLDPYVTLAARLVADVQIGDPPFYELMRYEDTPAMGGVNGVRGVPAGRYYGKDKVFGTVELRSELVQTRLFGAAVAFGTAVFFDAGRVWADWSVHPSLDGGGLGLKYGVGFGLRMRQGRAFLVRADTAWSPDAEPIGLYFTAGQMF